MKNIANILLIILLVSSCSVNQNRSDSGNDEDIYRFTVNEDAPGPWIAVEFKAGESFYYPLFAIWLEDLDGKYLQTLYVPESVATSVFRFGDIKDGKWVEGIRRWPQTLPYWAHKRNITASDGLYMPDPEAPVPDAYTGATPVTGFVMLSRSDSIIDRPVKVMLEVNQNWDWNEYWTNDKYPGDEYYRRSCQPALVYEAVIDPAMSGTVQVMQAIGHSHPSGATGELYTDLSTITTALEIADSIMVYLGKGR